MRFMIEVVADNRQDAANLLRDAALKIKHGKEASGEQVSHCIGDYRVIALGSPIVSYATERPQRTQKKIRRDARKRGEYVRP